MLATVPTASLCSLYLPILSILLASLAVRRSAARRAWLGRAAGVCLR